MNFKPNYLRGVLICLTLIIIFETGNFPTKLFAEFKKVYQELRLLQGEKSITIPSGDWIVCQLNENDNVYAGGILLGRKDQHLAIQDYKSDEIHSIPFESISMIYHGEAKRKLFYTWQWTKVGIFSGLAFGTFWTGWAVLSAQQDNDWRYVPIVALISYGCGESVAIPLGALIGFIHGLVKEGKAEQYFMHGENSWQFKI